MYIVVTIPNLRLLSDPTNVALLNRSSIRTERDHVITSRGEEPPNLYTEPLTPDERVSALRIIAATNTIIMALMGGVVLLQCAEVFIERQEEREAEKNRQLAAEELRGQLKGKDVAATEETKKSQ